MFEAVLVFVLGGGVLALWDYGRRRLVSLSARQDKLLDATAENEHKLLAATRKQQETILDRTTQLSVLADRVDEALEYQRRVLAAFINSATDILTISEEEKKHLRNKLQASKLNK